mmetsp:Transcript_64487/g.179413  ORF Transcript_64487/g.179413 Transcript_64487/m.179413 type:complete len:216 (+) Transcript_64487:1188-1835(+)
MPRKELSCPLFCLQCRREDESSPGLHRCSPAADPSHRRSGARSQERPPGPPRNPSRPQHIPCRCAFSPRTIRRGSRRECCQSSTLPQPWASPSSSQNPWRPCHLPLAPTSAPWHPHFRCSYCGSPTPIRLLHVLFLLFSPSLHFLPSLPFLVALLHPWLHPCALYFLPCQHSLTSSRFWQCPRNPLLRQKNHPWCWVYCPSCLPSRPPLCLWPQS